ncbi:MAG: O-antigen ligase family protein [Chitinophagaceae bacterium]
MEQNLFYPPGNKFNRHFWLLTAGLLSVYFGWLIAGTGFSFAGLLLVLPFLIGYLVLVFLFPRIGLISYIVYCFFLPGLIRHIVGPQFGFLVEALLILTWLGVIFHRGNKFRFRHLNRDLIWLGIIWFLITVLQIGNPEHPNIVGWLQEMRSTTLYWILTVPLAMMVFNKKSDIFLFLDIIVVLSLLGALYGIKQLYLGVDAAEHTWLEEGAYRTHILFGKLRVFSYYSEAAQFGASQAQLAIMCIILAVGPHSKARRIWYGIAAIFMFYGMLISGTRGALGALVGGGFIFLLLSKQVKILIVGSIIGVGFIGVLKFTDIGNGNDQIRRLRTATDPNDASLRVRLVNQQTLANSLASKPFGTGVGTIGKWGMTYNKHIYTSNIPPDSYFVKVWAMYGVVGFIVWFGIMLYILGKSAGIVWKTRDDALRNQLCALCAGFGGILLCSYGNEVMNTMPSSAIVYVSWALLWMSTRWDTRVQKLTSS